MSSEAVVPSTSRERDDDDDENENNQNKRIRLSTESMRITDLNKNCLEHIFAYLNLTDLLNVADTCKHFQSAAYYPFSRNFGKKVFVMRYSYKERLMQYPIDQVGKKICIWNLVILLRCLRCFGHLIKKLSINYDTVPIRDEIDLYVNQFCSDFVEEISFCWSIKGAMKNLTKPFKNVVSLAFSSCYLEDDIIKFNEKFPKMKRLKFSGANTITRHECIEMNFQHLEHLCFIDVDRHQSDVFFQPNNIAKCIQLNPMLRELEIGGELLDITFLKDVHEHLKNIENLSIKIQSPNSLQLETDSIRLNIKRLNIEIRSGTMNLALMPNIPFICNQIEEFTIKAYNLQLTDSLVDFVNKHATLTKLIVVDDRPDNNIKWRLPEASTTLKQIGLNSVTFTCNEAIEFLANFPSLEYFAFQIINRSHYKKLRNRLGSEWRGYDDHSSVRLEKKPTTN